ncbi:hypothetical protein [Human mastadenovirus D]|nr:hypothetical protein [Human adenovirus sp.]UKB92942.1 hypothetical protein [Human mastadenovirus D]UKB92980.1 hypothetical protein [Human mastadenovirus D]UKB93018.1 hypothetical protein [Human mastadenovirus D]
MGPCQPVDAQLRVASFHHSDAGLPRHPVLRQPQAPRRQAPSPHHHPPPSGPRPRAPRNYAPGPLACSAHRALPPQHPLIRVL